MGWVCGGSIFAHVFAHCFCPAETSLRVVSRHESRCGGQQNAFFPRQGQLVPTWSVPTFGGWLGHAKYVSYLPTVD